LIGGQVPLGFLADLAGTMLDALEAHFVLYDNEHAGVPMTPTTSIAAAQVSRQ
jgi:hypothetical protein